MIITIIPYYAMDKLYNYYICIINLLINYKINIDYTFYRVLHMYVALPWHEGFNLNTYETFCNITL